MGITRDSQAEAEFAAEAKRSDEISAAIGRSFALCYLHSLFELRLTLKAEYPPHKLKELRLVNDAWKRLDRYFLEEYGDFAPEKVAGVIAALKTEFPEFDD
jgi:hypothetical protein